MTPEVVLVGYYGRGNFGDDVLMVVAHRLIRQWMPGASMGIRLPPGADYVERLIGQDYTRVPFGTRNRHRLIVHGGGGTFFDFEEQGWLEGVTNGVLLAGGVSTYMLAERFLRWLVGRPRMSAQTRIGLGLGIGTFTAGSRRLREALPILADFKALWLRDPDSRANLSNLGVESPVVVGSDLAFLYEHWCPPTATLSTRRSGALRPRLGVILRDWPPQNGAAFANEMGKKLDVLANRYDLTVFSLDPKTDRQTIAALHNYPRVLWQPDTTDIPSFTEVLSRQDVLLTARAHGAICGACVGRPSVVLNIEPKLAAVHAMLPRATRIVEPDVPLRDLCETIDDALSIEEDSLAEDYLRNKSKSAEALTNVIGLANL